MNKKIFLLIAVAVLVFAISGVLYYRTFIANDETVVGHNELVQN